MKTKQGVVYRSIRYKIVSFNEANSIVKSFPDHLDDSGIRWQISEEPRDPDSHFICIGIRTGKQNHGMQILIYIRRCMGLVP